MSGTIPVYRWRLAPEGLATRRQLRAPGNRSAEHGYREMWRAPDGTLHPIADVLSGRIPH